MDPRADTSGLAFQIGTISQAVNEKNQVALTAKGYTCTAQHGGQVCQKQTTNTQYPVVDANTFFWRGKVFVNVTQSNFTTDDLIGSIVKVVWG
jgi:thiamine pyrophosphokinase